ncbi:uncharacterized protein J4E84_008098 [Alternaria hordeiaustralica]|uniref:uncharacterized protein n=1 Tax=Alternaria hordeiaustralica TaxID=1187925 RepID=UPI0020C2AB9A|nr:uncharacterized protein J4E84_008098 [Alternaria hordeiaustralica]KAI4680450.1 hypothetical protein J4E84_008098 [Alternaria hordeiaustralica]
MTLSALPPEILSKICRFIVAEDDPPSGILPERIKALRLSCREIYQKTLFDLGVLYGGMLDEPWVKLTYRSLCALLEISSAPYFRDRLRGVIFDWPYKHEYYGRTLSCDHEEYVDGLSYEELTAFTNSPDAVYILAQCFRNLAKSKSRQKLELCEEMTYAPVCAALNLALVSRQIVHVLVRPGNDYLSSHDRFLNTLIESAHLISHIELRATPHKDPEDMDSDMRQCDVAHNEIGRHYSGYKSVTPLLSKLAANLSSVKEITFHGCNNTPRLRLCHGCEDIWAGLFAKNTYSHLTHLELCNGYVSGSRLRGFIKRHARTLQHVKFEYMNLTDSTWRSIAQGLQKCPSLNYLDVGPHAMEGCYMGSLRQKHAAPPLEVSLPEKYATSGFVIPTDMQINVSDIAIILRNKTDVAHWLDVFVRYFATNKDQVNGYHLPGDPKRPVYYEVRTFLLTDQVTGIPDPRSRAEIALDRYLEEVEEA